jgi:serine/threonine protein kinase
VLVNSRGEVKLSDFGIASILEYTDQLSQTSVGTVRYMSLERFVLLYSSVIICMYLYLTNISINIILH